MLSPEEYRTCDATDLADLLRQGEVTPAEVAAIARQVSDALHPQINAVCELYPERVQQPTVPQARALTGIPTLLKDAGSAEQAKPQHAASRLSVGYTTTETDPLIQRYQQAGLNIIGRTTTPEFTMAATTESALYGATRNPWSLTHSTGGSSGGAAAAVASGIVPLAHGTDVGGSIRIPAACCGVVGFKPTQSPLPLRASHYGGLLVEHMLTRSVRDAALFTPAAGQVRASDNWRQRRLRVALWNDHVGSSGIQSVVTAVAETLASLGLHVEVASPAFDHSSWANADEIVWCMSTASEAARVSAVTGNPITADYLEPPILEAIDIANRLTQADWRDAMQRFDKQRLELAQFFARYDFLISPTVAAPTPKLGELNSNKNISFHDFMTATSAFCPHTAIFNVSKQPAISLPLGMLDNMPVGVQLVARPQADALLLELSATLEAAMPWRDRLPPVDASRL